MKFCVSVQTLRIGMKFCVHPRAGQWDAIARRIYKPEGPAKSRDRCTSRFSNAYGSTATKGSKTPTVWPAVDLAGAIGGGVVERMVAKGVMVWAGSWVPNRQKHRCPT